MGRYALAAALTFAGMTSTSRAQYSGSGEGGEVNTGQDVTKPVKRIDLRIGHNDSPSGEGTQTFILRHDRPISLSNGDQIGLRIDVPFVANDLVTPDNPTGRDDIGLGDLLLQALYIHPVNKREAVGFGTQIIIPTAREIGFGGGKWRAVPTIGYRWATPGISKGSFFAAALRYDFSFAGDDDRADVSELQFAPTLNIALPNQAFLTIFPSTDIRYDFKADSFFLPANAQIGKLWGRGVVTSLEGGVRIIGDAHAPYDWKAEARVGFFF